MRSSTKKYFSVLLCHCLLIFFLTARSQTLRPGDISPQVKYIEADEITPFNKGAAVIRKGAASALIDQHGNFIVPYKKYGTITPFTDPLTRGYTTGLFYVGTTNAILTNNGVLIGDIKFAHWQMLAGGEYLYAPMYPTTLIMDAKGKLSKTDDLNDASMKDYNEGLVPYIPKGSSKHGYKDLTGKVIVGPIYDFVSQVKNGMAVVGQYDQFSQMRYGYIDRMGKLIIPLTYSVPPHDFSGDVAMIYAKPGSGIGCLLIDKKGATIRQLSFDELREYAISDGSQFHGLRFGAKYILTVGGKIISYDDLLVLLGVRPTTPGERDFPITADYGDGKFYYQRGIPGKDGFHVLVGVFDINSKKRLEGPFIQSIGLPEGLLFFDKISGLAIAKMLIGKASGNANVFRTGYINEEGIFVIVLKEPSAF